MSETSTAPIDPIVPAEGTASQEAEHPGKFPPLDTQTFPSQLLWLAVFFTLLYVLMSRVVLPRLEAIVEGRSKQIEGDLGKAQGLKNETAAAVQAYEKSLADARSRAQTIIGETRAKLNAEVEAERNALNATLARKAAEADQRISEGRAKAMSQVDTVATDIVADIVAQLTDTKVSKADAAKAVVDASRG